MRIAVGCTVWIFILCMIKNASMSCLITAWGPKLGQIIVLHGLVDHLTLVWLLGCSSMYWNFGLLDHFWPMIFWNLIWEFMYMITGLIQWRWFFPLLTLFHFQVSRMLLGGMMVIGVYISVSESTFKNSTTLLCQVLLLL